MAVRLEYWNGEMWGPCGPPWESEELAWISLGNDNVNYRTVDFVTGAVLTDKRAPPPEEEVKVEDYLGDGVYAVFSGYNITLDLRGQDTFTKIALEPEVMAALKRFEERVYGTPR